MKGKNRQKSSDNFILGAGVLLLTMITLLAVLVPVFSGQSYTAQNPDMQNLGSSAAHFFGTDKFGRDLFVRVWYGTRISLVIGIGSMLICGMIGVVIGAAAGYSGGIFDLVCMRFADLVDAVPSLLYVILITLTFGANAGSILLGICISGWAESARIIRTEVQRVMTQDFCEASRLSGAGALWVLRKHLIPNALGPVIVSLIFFIPKAIFTEAFLSFVGVGIEAPQASLGSLIQAARSQMRLYPTQMLYPILVLSLLLISLHLIGVGLEQKEGWGKG